MSTKPNYEDKYVKTNRTFPVANTVLLVVLIALQIGLVILGIAYQPKPQDRIRQYDVTVEPLDDGSLDITYSLIWEALDTTEPLTWVEIGMANSNYSIYPNSISSNIVSYLKYAEDDYVSLRLYFNKQYKGGEVVEFSFKVNQKDMLCLNEKGYFYEFVPCWFNAIQVEHYRFTWKMEGFRDYVQTGSLDYGEYKEMQVQYGMDDFAGCKTVKYKSFDADDAYNEMTDEKNGILVLCIMGAAALILIEVYIVDSYVSYNRGRGFLTGYGHHVHTYGRSNPHYIRARDRHIAKSSSSSRGGRSGGCACACACACAGGGRAGCSQKDTYGTES